MARDPAADALSPLGQALADCCPDVLSTLVQAPAPSGIGQDEEDDLDVTLTGVTSQGTSSSSSGSSSAGEAEATGDAPPLTDLQAILTQAAADAAPAWQQLVLVPIPGLEEILSVVTPVLQVIASILQVIATILEILAALIIDLSDPFHALILAAIEAIQALINDLLNAGAYVYADAPGITSPIVNPLEVGLMPSPAKLFRAGQEGKSITPVDPFEGWASRFAASFNDPGDKARPQFSRMATIEAVFIMAAAPSLADLAKAINLIGQLFNIDAFKQALDRYAEALKDPKADPEAARRDLLSVAPDWHSVKLVDMWPELKELTKLADKLKGLLLQVGGLATLIKNLAKAVRAKANLLQELVKTLDGILELLRALKSSGLYTLHISTSEGINGLTNGFVSATNRPLSKVGKSRPQQAYIGGVALLLGGPGMDSAVFKGIFGSMEAAVVRAGDNWEDGRKVIDARADQIGSEP